MLITYQTVINWESRQIHGRSRDESIGSCSCQDFDRRRYGFAQVAIVPTLLEEVVLPDQRSTARQNRRCLRDDSLDHLRG
jgi:hypothetical protein